MRRGENPDCPTTTRAKPFLKWAGGKGRLIDQYEKFLPSRLKKGKIRRYIDPFVGGGAFFFHIAQNYDIPELVINDINGDLILVYRTIQHDVEKLILELEKVQTLYHAMNSDGQKSFFYETRTMLNVQRPAIDYGVFQKEWIARSAQIIFLNRTCFNGLFRMNSRGDFNVPFGRYKNPAICRKDNLRLVSRVLSRTEILNRDFEKLEHFAHKDAFIYFDPPYRPLNKTSNFTSYSSNVFDDEEQLRLARFFRRLDKKGALLMLSNSDPANHDTSDDFFHRAYEGFRIATVNANRMINSVEEKRGAIGELVIVNY